MRDSLWTRGYILALGVTFSLSLVFFLLMTTMALYAAQNFGSGDVVAGLASSIFVIGALMARLAAGLAIGRFGTRRVLVVALTVSVVAAFAYLPAGDLLVLLLVRLLHGMAFGTAHTAASTVVQMLIPSSRRAEGTGYLGATTTLGTAVGPFVAVVLMRNVGVNGVFLAAAFASILALIVALGLRVSDDGPRQRRPRGAPRVHLLQPRALPIASFNFIGALSFSGVVAFVNPFATSIGLASTVAVFFVVYAAVILVSRPFVGRLQDARGDNVVLYPAIVAFATGLVLLAVSQHGVVLLASAVLLGLGWGSMMSASQAVAVSSAPIADVGRTISTYFLLADLGMGAGPVLLGWIVGVLDYRWMYGTTAAIMLLSIFYYRKVHGSGETQRRRGPGA